MQKEPCSFNEALRAKQSKNLFAGFSFTSKFTFDHPLVILLCAEKKFFFFKFKKCFRNSSGKHYSSARREPDSPRIYGLRWGGKQDRPVGGPRCELLNWPPTCKSEVDLGQHQVALHFHSPFWPPLLFPLPGLVCMVGNLLSIGGVPVCLNMIVRPVGQALGKPKGPLAMNSNWVCYLNLNTSRQVWQMSRGRRASGWDAQASPQKNCIFREEQESYLHEQIRLIWLIFPFLNHSLFFSDDEGIIDLPYISF